MLNDNDDKRSLYFLSVTTLIYFGLIHIRQFPLPTMEYLIYLVVGAIGGVTSIFINHNHRHLYIFKNKWLNYIVNLWITILIGQSSTKIHSAHINIHHANSLEIIDGSKNKLIGNEKGLLRILKYLAHYLHSYLLNQKNIVLNQTDKQMRICENTFLFLFILFTLWFNWRSFLIFIFPIWILTNIFFILANLLNYDNCKLDNSVHHTRDFVSPIENWMFCNIGYHSAHLLDPNIHWSKLPLIHRKNIVPLKNKNLIDGSMIKYLISNITNTSIDKNKKAYLK